MTEFLSNLAMKKAVILTDIPAHRAVIGEEKCGLYITSIKPKEIADAIEHAYINRRELESWGEIGRELIKEKYTWQRVAMDLDSYLSSITDTDRHT